MSRPGEGSMAQSPIVLLVALAAGAKQTAAVSAAFIVANSIAGLASRPVAGPRISLLAHRGISAPQRRFGRTSREPNGRSTGNSSGEIYQVLTVWGRKPVRPHVGPAATPGQVPRHRRSGRQGEEAGGWWAVSSLRSRLLAIIIVAVVPSFGLAVYSAVGLRGHAAASAIESAEGILRQVSAEHERLDAATRVLLDSLTHAPVVRDRDAARCSAFFADLVRQYPAYANMGAADADGTVFCSAMPMREQVNIADRPYFQRAVRSRAFAAGGFQIGRITGRPGVNYCSPVLHASGAVRGVVFAEVDLRWLNRLAAGPRMPEGAVLTMVDSAGTILSRHPDHDRWIGRVMSEAPVTKAILSRREGTAEVVGVDGVQRVYAFAPVGGHGREGGAYVAVGTPSSVVFAAFNRLVFRLAALLVLAAALATWVATAGANRVVLEPVRALAVAAGRLAEGDLSARTGLVGQRGEMGDLARAFDGMAAALQARQAEAERAEEEIRRLNADLEDRVIERTAQIAERERDLRAARDEADRANQAKSEFISRMSHELRTPLNAVLGFGQLLEMDDLTPTQREDVAHILKGGRHLLDLINEVLDIARIEAGRMSLSPEPVPVAEVIRESMDLVTPMASERRVHLLRAGTDGISDLFVLADRQRLRQVLLNLLSNAVKFNRQEGTVSLSCQEAPGYRVRIGVRDTGSGIPPEQMERLFVPFERLSAEQAGVEGTGLGLVLSRHLVEAMGGALGVESEAGVGSNFWVELPAAESPSQRLERAGVALPAPADLDDSTRVRIVLYIEDNLSNVHLIQRLLAHRPEVRLIPAMQGRLGLELAREHRPHLVLLDLHLPDIPGQEVLRLLQESPKTQGIPVVVISADATPRQVGRLIEAGARDYLTKPLDVSRLMGVLDSILGKG